jgi:hypothetical protein
MEKDTASKPPTGRTAKPSHSWLIITVALFIGLGICGARAKTLRIVSYNIDCEDQSSDGNITNASHSLPTVVQAIGLHHLGTNAQPADLLNVEELNSTSLSNFVVALTNIYGAGSYAYDHTTDTNTGGGPDGLIYNPRTVQVVSARCLKDGDTVLLQANGAYATAHSFGGGVNGVPRSPMCYRLRPAGYGASYDFYMYVSHARASSSDNAVGDARYAEAQEVRSDAKYNLPAGSHMLYAGDWNLDHGSYENAYKCLTGQTTADGINWSDTSAIWANTNQTQAFDPMSKTSPPTTVTWTNAAADIGTYLYDDATEGSFAMTSRLDIQLPNALMFAAYNGNGGMQLAPDTADPYDLSNFPAAQFPYAFETFGNDGSTTRGSTATSASNHSLNDLTTTTPNATTVYTDLQEAGTGSGSTFVGSDHYPIMGDYDVVPEPPTSLVLTALGFTNQNFQLELVSTSTNTGFGILASTNLANWSNVGSGYTGTNGVLIFQDTNAGGFRFRFYRAYWPLP